jgi:hypothetical protein
VSRFVPQGRSSEYPLTRKDSAKTKTFQRLPVRFGRTFAAADHAVRKADRSYRQQFIESNGPHITQFRIVVVALPCMQIFFKAYYCGLSGRTESELATQSRCRNA